jgi:hypothetical protein
MTWKRAVRIGFMAAALLAIVTTWTPAWAITLATSPRPGDGLPTTNESRAAIRSQLNSPVGIGVQNLVGSSEGRARASALAPAGGPSYTGSLGQTPAEMPGSILGYTSTLRFSKEGLYAAAYTLAEGEIPQMEPEDIALPPSIVLLGSALALASVASRIRRRRRQRLS